MGLITVDALVTLVANRLARPTHPLTVEDLKAPPAALELAAEE